MFAFGYLFDENLDGTLPEALRDRHPSLPVGPGEFTDQIRYFSLRDLSPP